VISGSVKLKCENAEVPRYVPSSKTIILPMRFKSPTGNMLNGIGPTQLGDSDVSTVVHEMYHAVYDIRYKGAKRGGPGAQDAVAKDIESIQRDARTAYVGKKIADGDIRAIQQERIGNYVEAMVFRHLDGVRFIRGVATGRRILTHKEFYREWLPNLKKSFDEAEEVKGYTVTSITASIVPDPYQVRIRDVPSEIDFAHKHFISPGAEKRVLPAIISEDVVRRYRGTWTNLGQPDARLVFPP
jgi:hypothetical protein